VNLSDIGYGVSQVLPVVVQSVLRKDATTLLIQQPEVHLHPRAQAALGTFFAQIAETERMFVIETHSDYLVDRVRQEVAKGTIKSEDVQILFFDKPGLETTIHQLTLDENGNVENAPDEYRSFFMEESINLLTRTDG
jgi:predicted ATPase